MVSIALKQFTTVEIIFNTLKSTLLPQGLEKTINIFYIKSRNILILYFIVKFSYQRNTITFQCSKIENIYFFNYRIFCFLAFFQTLVRQKRGIVFQTYCSINLLPYLKVAGFHQLLS